MRMLKSFPCLGGKVRVGDFSITFDMYRVMAYLNFRAQPRNEAITMKIAVIALLVLSHHHSLIFVESLSKQVKVQNFHHSARPSRRWWNEGRIIPINQRCCSSTSAHMSAPTELDYWPPRAEDRAFDWSQPTCDVYRIADTHKFSGPFRESRSKLDYSYHKNPILDRQLYQDMVLARILEADNEEDETAPQCPDALESHKRPFLVFTAGSMGAGKSYVLSQLHQRGVFPLQNLSKSIPICSRVNYPRWLGICSTTRNRQPPSCTGNRHKCPMSSSNTPS